MTSGNCSKYQRENTSRDFVREKRNNRERSHTGVGPTSSKRAPMLHQLNAVMRGIYRLSGRRKCSIISFFGHSAHRTLGNAPLLLGTFAKGLALTGIGTPVELDPFSETNYVTFPSKGWQADEVNKIFQEVCFFFLFLWWRLMYRCMERGAWSAAWDFTCKHIQPVAPAVMRFQCYTIERNLQVIEVTNARP